VNPVHGLSLQGSVGALHSRLPFTGTNCYLRGAEFYTNTPSRSSICVHVFSLLRTQATGNKHPNIDASVITNLLHDWKRDWAFAVEPGCGRTSKEAEWRSLQMITGNSLTLCESYYRHLWAQSSSHREDPSMKSSKTLTLPFTQKGGVTEATSLWQNDSTV
jgi:hypothetical protein